VDGETIIDGDDDREITLYNLMPGTDGLMNLNNGQETIYFVGSITITYSTGNVYEKQPK
jgi:hypothetical protein